MSKSKTILRQKIQSICIAGLNSAFDQNGHRCYFGAISNISFLNISLEINIERQPTFCLYVFEETLSQHDEIKNDYIEFDGKIFPIRRMLKIEEKFDTHFFTFKMTTTAMTAFVDYLLSYFLNSNRIFEKKSLLDLEPYQIDWWEHGLSQLSYNDEGFQTHQYRGITIYAPFNSIGTGKRVIEMFNRHSFSKEHFDYFDTIVPLLEDATRACKLN